jgi:hypothetical protein
MSLELSGKIKKVFPTQTFDSGFTKREFVVTTDEQYPQDVKFELIKDKVDMIDSYKTDDAVKVSFNVRGNEWNDKYFVNLQAWRLEKSSGAPLPSNDVVEEMNATFSDAATADDDLPF